MTWKAATAVLAICTLQLAGCSITGKGLDPGPSGAVRLSAPSEPGGDKPSDYPIHLPQLIVLAVHGNGMTPLEALADARKTSKATTTPPDAAASAPFNSRPSELEEARKYFYDNCQASDRCGQMRDRVQDRLIWASESACSDYLSQVRRSFISTNLNLGSATTLLGALGSILTSTDATRVFSGAAAVASGLRAEYNEVYFSSQAFELVSKAIRLVREKALKNLLDNRRGRPITDYTLDGAIADAVRYHSTCNVMAGLEEAADAVTRERDPGLRRISELLQGVGAAVNLSLGTAALDTGALPSALESCLRLDTTAAEGAKLAADFLALVTQLKADATADSGKKQEATTRLDAVTKAAAELKTLQESVKAECTGTAANSVKTVETEMFESMRIFAGLPLAEKAVGKAAFDAARAKVLALKLKIDSVTAEARGKLDLIAAKAKLP